MRKNLKHAAVGLTGLALFLAIVGLAIAATNTLADVRDLSKWDNRPEPINGAVELYPEGAISTVVTQVPTGNYLFSIAVRAFVVNSATAIAVEPSDYGVLVDLLLNNRSSGRSPGQLQPRVVNYVAGSAALGVIVERYAEIASATLPKDASLVVQLYSPELRRLSSDPGGGGSDEEQPTPPETAPPEPTQPPEASPVPTPQPSETPFAPPVDVEPTPAPLPTPVPVTLHLRVLPSRLILDDLAVTSGGGLYGDGPSADVVAVALDSEGKVDTNGTMTVRLSDRDTGFGQLVGAPVSVAHGDPQYLGLYLPPAQADFKSRTVRIEAVYQVTGQEPLRTEAAIEVVRITTVRDRESALTVKAGARNLYMQVKSQ